MALRHGSKIPIFVPIGLAMLALSCGGGAGPQRALEAITVSPATVSSQNPAQVQFIATGHYSAPPITLTPPANTTWGV